MIMVLIMRWWWWCIAKQWVVEMAKNMRAFEMMKEVYYDWGPWCCSSSLKLQEQQQLELAIRLLLFWRLQLVWTPAPALTMPGSWGGGGEPGGAAGAGAVEDLQKRVSKLMAMGIMIVPGTLLFHLLQVAWVVHCRRRGDHEDSAGSRAGAPSVSRWLFGCDQPMGATTIWGPSNASDSHQAIPQLASLPLSQRHREKDRNTERERERERAGFVSFLI
jgi:hypothetical protein